MTVRVEVSNKQDRFILDGYRFADALYKADDYLRDMIDGFLWSEIASYSACNYVFDTEESATLFKMKYLT